MNRFLIERDPHGIAVSLCDQHIVKMPEGKNTKHPQCFSGHDDCRTDEFYPIKAYRKFYAKTKMTMARYNKTDNIPEWLNYSPLLSNQRS